MDREAITASVAYGNLGQQHFNGGYFSEAVRTEAERVKGLGEEERLAFFKDTFNEVHESAALVQCHPRFNSKTESVDLSDEGLGSVRVALTVCTEEEAKNEGINPYRGVMVWSEAFNPTPDNRRLEEPHRWEDHVYANLDGSFKDDEGDDIDYETMRLLDAKETLGIVHEALSKETTESAIPTPEVSLGGLDQLLADTANDLVENEAAVRRAREMQIGSIAKKGYIDRATRDAEQSQSKRDHTTAILASVFTVPETLWVEQIADRVEAIKRERTLTALEDGSDAPWYR